ncbi:MAG: nucleoid-associated protein [Lewinellaceae bacterium]|nr:nucleoid-associated protein [Lewinellaceae bacterium]
MPIELQQLIIHELEKNPDTGEVSVFLTDEPLPADDQAIALVQKLNRAFEFNTEMLQGDLCPPDEALFPGYFQVLVDNALTTPAFLDFSRETMQALQLSLQGVVGAKGAYVVYANYTLGEQHYLGIFLVRDTHGVIFQRAGSRAAFSLQSTTYLNTDRLALACRIRVDRFRQGGNRCVELIKYARSQKEISQYFIHWIGLHQPVSSRELTDSFLELLEELPLPVDAETGVPLEAGQFEEQVLQFAKSSPDKAINLRAFDQAFYGESNTLEPFLQDKNFQLDDEFRYDQGTLQRHFNFRVQGDGLTLHFTRTQLSLGLVRIEGDQVILHAPELAQEIAALREEQ